MKLRKKIVWLQSMYIKNLDKSLSGTDFFIKYKYHRLNIDINLITPI